MGAETAQATNGQVDREVRGPVDVTYAVDEATRRIYWRCEGDECESRKVDPERRPHEGAIDYDEGELDRGLVILGGVATAHVWFLDSAPLGTLNRSTVTEGEGHAQSDEDQG